MATTVKIKSDKLLKRLDAIQSQYGLETRQNTAIILLRKAIDFVECNGWEEILKLPTRKIQESCEHESGEFFQKIENREKKQYMKCLDCGFIQRI